MLSHIQQEEAKLDAMQRVWQTSRRATTMSFFEDADAERELFALPRQNSCGGLITRGQCASPPPCTPALCADYGQEFNETFQEIKTVQDGTTKRPHRKSTEKPSSLLLDASECGDFPARYIIAPVEAHQFPVCGVYIDNRVIPGFKYRVRPLPAVGEVVERKHGLPCMFGGRALTLQSIGRGYARRFTFEADENHLNDNDNYFWSDNRPEGYAFELELISEGDKFTIFDANREAQGTLEVVKLEGPQVEISGSMSAHSVEKRVRVKLIAKVEFFETGVAKPTPVTGVAVAIKQARTPHAVVTRVSNVMIKGHRYSLLPGVAKEHRRATVRGADLGDVPTKYTMAGLEACEIPVVGTYVDARVVPGFHYRVRPNDRSERLFDGRTLKLLSIGMGYAKRLTFQPDSLLEPDNYLWSDSHPDGLGLEPRAVHTGMRFAIVTSDGQRLGDASVFRADMAQKEESMERVPSESHPGHYAIEKRIYVDVMCHVRLACMDSEEHLMNICGVAVCRKEPKSNDSYVVRVENIGMDSQLKLLFAYNHTDITFVPIVVK